MESTSSIKKFFTELGCKKEPLKDFDEMLAKYSEGNVNMPLSNSSLKYATVISQHIVKKAKKTIRIFTSSEAFKEGGMYADMGEWLNDGVEVMIYCDGEPSIHMIAPPKGIHIKLATPAFRKAVAKTYKALNYFMTADEQSYRREYDTDHHIGVMNFNDPEKTGQLIALFDEHFNGLFRPKPTFWERIQGN